ncbi:MAG: MoaD/ThiS family protein [Rhodobacter sp.]|nr:MoaD/ThiS family protein [Paracoccaceae bacterium]MCC0076986.1 MoaD/ThiS family protein [Rhodobacter sp.]
MVEVHLWSGLRRFTDGALVVPVEAETVGQMLDALVRAHPGLKPVIDAGVSVVIDGEVLTGGLHRAVTAQNEIYLMQRIKGG